MSVKMWTTYTWTERLNEASLFHGIYFGLFLCSLGRRRRMPPSGRPKPLVTEACKGFLEPDENWPLSVKVEESLIARPTHRARMKVSLSDPTVPSGRVVAQWIKGYSMFQGLGCLPIKAVSELGLERRETVRSIFGVGVRALRGHFPSTRGPRRTHLWCISYRVHGKSGVAKYKADNC
ncbi:hypothetical protein Goari_024190 [Gossypium aridum]|uniref:Uncharacterized protein n=1 Tax=Gossypium aridum TaxID=34290 RepID=A0A7J8X5E6_GOSAI|nr:hypothetical protein [Gossypium aridum]